MGYSRELQLLCYMSNYCSALETKALLLRAEFFSTNHSQHHTLKHKYLLQVTDFMTLAESCKPLSTSPTALLYLCGLYIRMVLCRSFPYVGSRTTLMLIKTFIFHPYMSITRRLVATCMGIARWVFFFNSVGLGNSFFLDSVSSSVRSSVSNPRCRRRSFLFFPLFVNDRLSG